MSTTNERDPFSLGRHDIKEWPRRLLHVLHMRSYERVGENIYGGVREPVYNILSYIWGRWQMPTSSGQSLNIDGISWSVPSIRPEIFTPTEFQSALKQVSVGVDWLWVDVACIDQEDEKIRDEEIGRQAGIFNNAKEAFIWLHHSPIHKLQRFFDLLFEISEKVDEIDDDIWSDDTWKNALREILEVLDEDPWFSSLWTLQEAYLRSEATLLSKEGLRPQREGYSRVGLASVLVAFGNIDYVIKYSTRSESSDIQSPSWLRDRDEISRRIDKLGLAVGDNPVLLYSSAGFRQTGPTNQTDRIYGIMQVFGFRLGKSVIPGAHFSLSQLEIQFAAALNEKSAVWAQLFVHTKSQPAGQHWCISQSSRLPESLTLAAIAPRSLCKIALDDKQRAHFTGQACSFGDLKRGWENARGRMSLRNFWGMEINGMALIEVIALDRCEFTLISVPAHLLEIKNELSDENQKLGNLLKPYNDELRVFLLGKIYQVVDVEESDEDEEERVGDLELSAGMLVRRIERNHGTAWQRLGVTVWADIGDEDDAVHWYETRSMLD